RNAQWTGNLVRPRQGRSSPLPHSACCVRMSHLLALGLLALDCVVRAWRIQLAAWTAGGRLAFNDAFRLNLYGEAASQLTPNRLGGEPARFLGLTESGLRPVTGLVAIGVEVACEWPVFLLAAAALFVYYVPDWRDAAGVWLHRHRAGELVTIEVVALIVLLAVYLLQRLARSGMIRHRVRRQWRVAWAHVRRAPRWVLGAGAEVELFKIGWGKTRGADTPTLSRMGRARKRTSE